MLNEYDALGMGFNKPRKTPSFFKISLFIMAGFIALVLFAYLYLVNKNKGNIKAVSTVTIQSFQGEQIYLVSDYKIDSVTHCINFTELTGIKRTACNNFVVATY